MKRIALIVTGTALLVASCGIASAANKTEVTMPNHLIAPYPAELETKGLMLAPNTAYQLLNPVSPEQQVAKAEARKHVTRPQYTVSPEQQVAKAEARKHVTRPQYTVSPEQQVAKAEARKHVTRPQYTVSPEQQVAKAEARKLVTRAYVPGGSSAAVAKAIQRARNPGVEEEARDEADVSGDRLAGTDRLRRLPPRRPPLQRQRAAQPGGTEHAGADKDVPRREWHSGRRRPDQRPAVTARSRIASRLRAGRSQESRHGAYPRFNGTRPSV